MGQDRERQSCWHERPEQQQQVRGGEVEQQQGEREGKLSRDGFLISLGRHPPCMHYSSIPFLSSHTTLTEAEEAKAAAAATAA